MIISYGITVCNEHKELEYLITYISKLIDKEDEIVVVYDQNRVTDEVMEVLSRYEDICFQFPFNFRQDFLENKNYMNSKCNGEYIFQIDADEIPSEVLVNNLKNVLKHNPVDVLITPRVNLVKGLTQDHIDKWKWNVNDKGHINWPDYQTRIYRNTEDVTWMNKVHERITGYDTFSNFPAEEQWSLYHPKKIDRQETQNKFYETI
jgi:hypothetical protein